MTMLFFMKTSMNKEEHEEYVKMHVFHSKRITQDVHNHIT